MTEAQSIDRLFGMWNIATARATSYLPARILEICKEPSGAFEELRFVKPIATAGTKAKPACKREASGLSDAHSQPFRLMSLEICARIVCRSS
jgi:hypothetical protein